MDDEWLAFAPPTGDELLAPDRIGDWHLVCGGGSGPYFLVANHANGEVAYAVGAMAGEGATDAVVATTRNGESIEIPGAFALTRRELDSALADLESGQLEPDRWQRAGLAEENGPNPSPILPVSCTVQMQASYHSANFGGRDDEYMAAEEHDTPVRVGSLFMRHAQKAGGFMLLTAAHTARVRVTVRSTVEAFPPEVDPDEWEDMVATTIDVPSGELMAQTCFGDGETTQNLITGPGRYGVRIFGRDRDVVASDDPNEPAPEAYLVDIWPAPANGVLDAATTTSEAGREIEMW